MSKNILDPLDTLIDAISAIESTDKRLAVVISKENLVIGTLTDGDIRRYILEGYSLKSKVSEAMNNNPVVASVNTSDSVLHKILVKNNIRSLPLVDENNKYIRTLHETELSLDDRPVHQENNFATAVIMAGGEGLRLRPHTKNIPKPMMKIDGLPLLERQIRRLSNMGIDSIYIAVNYLSGVIEDYFGDGSNFGVKLRYLHEREKMGTAGALSLLPNIDKINSILVINGDILTNSDFINLFHFHEDQNAAITIGAVDYHIEIPFGVLEFDGVKVKSLKEKPSQNFFCNAGIYALSNQALKKIPTNKFFNMTDLIEQSLVDNEVVSVFPVHEYWSDIGTKADLDKARENFKIISSD